MSRSTPPRSSKRLEAHSLEIERAHAYLTHCRDERSTILVSRPEECAAGIGDGARPRREAGGFVAWDLDISPMSHAGETTSFDGRCAMHFGRPGTCVPTAQLRQVRGSATTRPCTRQLSRLSPRAWGRHRADHELTADRADGGSDGGGFEWMRPQTRDAFAAAASRTGCPPTRRGTLPETPAAGRPPLATYQENSSATLDWSAGVHQISLIFPPST